jgi:hypothetical protein
MYVCEHAHMHMCVCVCARACVLDGLHGKNCQYSTHADIVTVPCFGIFCIIRTYFAV